MSVPEAVDQALERITRRYGAYNDRIRFERLALCEGILALAELFESGAKIPDIFRFQIVAAKSFRTNDAEDRLERERREVAALIEEAKNVEIEP